MEPSTAAAADSPSGGATAAAAGDEVEPESDSGVDLGGATRPPPALGDSPEKAQLLDLATPLRYMYPTEHNVERAHWRLQFIDITSEINYPPSYPD